MRCYMMCAYGMYFLCRCCSVSNGKGVRWGAIEGGKLTCMPVLYYIFI
jgi:hypothetical protein